MAPAEGGAAGQAAAHLPVVIEVEVLALSAALWSPCSREPNAS
jgi:hypothetical protein